jgi:hypothetical protein
MKRFAIRTLLVAAAVIGFAAQAARAQADVDVNVTIGGFYDELAPYGRWVDCSYGQCWVPGKVAADWQPYSNGQWIYTEYGWTWVSNDPWGGNPYHYGTWASIPGYGWSWVPGTVWAPAWVTWSYSNNYVGWAPLPPTVAFGSRGYSGSPIVVSQAQYVFVPTNRFVGVNVTSVRIPAQRSAEIFRQTRPVTGFAVSGGIVRNTALPMETVQRATGSKIETRSIQTAGTAPRAVAAGSAHLSVVAPAREVKAAVAARPQAVSRTAESSEEQKHVNAPVDRQPASAKAPKAHEAPSGQPAEATAARHPAPPPKPEAGQQAELTSKPKPKAVKEKPAEKSHGQPAEAPAAHQQAPPPKPEAGQQAVLTSKPKPKAVKEKPVEKSHGQPAEAPAAHPQAAPPKPEAGRPAEKVSEPKPQPEKERPEEKDKKPDGEML